MNEISRCGRDIKEEMESKFTWKDGMYSTLVSIRSGLRVTLPIALTLTREPFGNVTHLSSNKTYEEKWI